jgi:predicted cupin superfamily sugar epimerase
MSAGTAPAAAGLAGLDAAQVSAALDMLPHREGGYYRETYRSSIVTPTPMGSRSLCTSILYLLSATDPSRFHRLRFDEVWFFHAGSPVEMIFLDPVETVVVGPDSPQALVPGGRWMAARILGSESRGEAPNPEDAPTWALVGCVVSPGFEYDDFEAGRRETLIQEFPGAADLIRPLVL